MKGKSFTYILISRRQCYRAGTRYYMRGIDLEGYAANYVETEQIIEYDGNRASFVQAISNFTYYFVLNYYYYLQHTTCMVFSPLQA